MPMQLLRISGKVVAFPATRARRNWLTPRDVQAADDWKPRLSSFGFDRLEYNTGALCNDPDLQDFLSLYRPLDSWASWCFAREGLHIVAWRNDTGRAAAQILRPSMDTAIRAVLRLGGAAVEEVVEDETLFMNVILFPGQEGRPRLSS